MGFSTGSPDMLLLLLLPPPPPPPPCGVGRAGGRQSNEMNVKVCTWLMADYFGNVWIYASAVGVLVAAYFVFSSFASKDNYSHKRSDQEQENPMADVTPPRKGDYTPQQLVEHDGRDPSKAVLLSLFSAPCRPFNPRCPPAATSPCTRNRVRRHRRPLLLWSRRPLRNLCRS